MVDVTEDELYTRDWIEFYDSYMSEDKYKERFNILFERIKKYNPCAANVLELACGTGNYSKLFLGKGFNVTGTDLSYDAILKARKKVRWLNILMSFKRIRAKFYMSNMTTVKEFLSFDVVTCMFESFRYLKNKKESIETLTNAYNALTPGGLFICDFSIFPESKEKKTVLTKTLQIKRKIFKQEEIIQRKKIGKNKFDLREDIINIFLKRHFKDPLLIETKKLNRAKLLCISQSDMKKWLRSVGFKLLPIKAPFTPDSPNTHLFIAQKNLE